MAPTLSRSLTESPQRAIGGQTLNALHNNIFSATSQPQIDYLYSYYNAVPHNAHFLTSTNLLLCRDRFNAIGGFDIAFPRAMGVAHTISDFYMLVAGTGIRFEPLLFYLEMLCYPYRTFQERSASSCRHCSRFLRWPMWRDFSGDGQAVAKGLDIGL